MLKPQRHRDTEKTQSHPPTHEEPQITQINADPTRPRRKHKDTKAQRVHEASHRLFNVETQRRREFLASVHDVTRFWPSNDGQEPLDRTAATNARIRSGSSTQWPALSERRSRHFSFLFGGWDEPPPQHHEKKIAGCSAANNRVHLADSTISPLLLCPFSPLRFLLGRAGAFVSSCLCVCDGLCVSVALWFFYCLVDSEKLFLWA
jgi:hypothetical protein